ncbi:putative membrane protein, partial [Escherichia coli 6-319-05_S4_C3]
MTETIVFFYICLNLFLRYLWLALAFSAVRFSVHGINRS